MLFIVFLFLIVKVSCNFYIQTQNINLQCGGVFNENQYIIQSPNYPSNYPSNIDCIYVLNGENCLREYHLQLLDFSLEDSIGCTGDRLEVENKDVLCGNIGDTKTYITTNGVLQLRFVTNSNKSGRGFRILITRSSCKNINPIVNTTSVESNAEYCCERSYNKKHFYLTSPNFPYSNRRANCVYQVLKANRNVCRMRMHFMFFLHGDNEYNDCIGGHLEIDNKRFCGCRSGLKVIIPFGYENMKIIRYLHSHPLNNVRGFLLEVIQDECPKRINITKTITNQNVSDVIPSNNTSNVTDKEIYSMPQNEQSTFSDQYPRNRYIEETTYYDTSVKNRYLPPENDYQCRATIYLQYMLLQNSGLLQKIQQCSSNSQNELPNNCVQLPYIKGYFHTAGYPFYYPPNSVSCFRIIKQRGYCKLRLLMLDFHLEDSLNCMKDYFVTDSGQRYCGNSLRNTENWYDFKDKSHKEFKFVTDHQYCGRGLKAIYEQIKCRHEDHPTIPSRPTLCGGNIRDRTFTIRIDTNQNNCEYNVIKMNPGVCSLELNLLSFDIPCNRGYMLLQNNKYCGNLSGQKLFVNFYKETLPIIIQREQHSKEIAIEGHQVNYGCAELPPAERILLIDTTTVNDTNLNRNESIAVTEPVNIS